MTVPVPPPTLPPPPAAGMARRVVRLLFTPVRFVLRRPTRAALYLALALVIGGLAAAVGVRIWFEHHLRVARTELERGHNAVALRHLRLCQRASRDDRAVLILSARVARRSGALDEADALLARYSELYTDDDPVAFERILLRATRGDVEEVRFQLAARIRTSGPESELAREALVAGLLYQFRWGEAYRHLGEWKAQNPNSTTALLLSGKLEEQRQGTEAAIAAYRQVLALDPDHDEAQLRLTDQLISNRRGDEALPHVEVLRGRLPNHPEVAVLWVRALALVGRTAESRSALGECLRAHPDYPPALRERGEMALIDGDEPTAETYFARAVELEPGSLVALNRYAFALARNGKAEAAARARAEADSLKADLERITILIAGPLQERPNDPSVHHEIAQIALRSGQLREALRWFTSALRVDPNYTPTHRVLAALYRELDNPILAARHRALAQRASDPRP